MVSIRRALLLEGRVVLMLVHTRCHREGLFSGPRQFRPHVKFQARVSRLLGWAKGRGDLGPWIYRGYVWMELKEG